MSFSTEPKPGPNVLNPPAATARSTSQAEARARAIAKLVESSSATPQPSPDAFKLQVEPTPVPNPTSISPEELSAIAPKVSQNDNVVEMDANASDPTPAISEVTEPKKAEDPLSSHYAQLARKEKALRAQKLQQEQSLKAREAQIKAREDALTAKDAEYQSKFIDKSKLQQDPLAVLSELGLSYEELTNRALNAPRPEEVAQKQIFDKLQAEIKAVREAQEQAQQAVQDQQKQAYNQAVGQIREEVKSLVESNQDYSIIKSTNSVDDVVELIEKTYEKDRILLTVEEAAKEVEDFLAEEASKLFQIDKIKKRFETAFRQPEKQESQVTQQALKQQQQPVKTLTNAVTSGKRMSARERAIARFNGTLKV